MTYFEDFGDTDKRMKAGRWGDVVPMMLVALENEKTPIATRACICSELKRLAKIVDEINEQKFTSAKGKND